MIRGHQKATVLDQAPQRACEILVTSGRLREGIFAETQLLIALGGSVHMELVELLGFQRIGMLMALPVVSAQPEQTRGLRRQPGYDDREVKRVERGLS